VEVEHGRGGRVNRIPSTTLWELTEGPGSLTKVRVSYWTEPANPVDRALERLSAASIPYERRWREALRRLRIPSVKTKNEIRIDPEALFGLRLVLIKHR